MPTTTYIPLANVTLSSSASSVTFSSISQLYRDLILIATGTGTGNVNLCARLNGDSGNNYADVYAYGTGSSSVSSADTPYDKMNISAAAYWSTSNPATTTFQVFDYSSTGMHKNGLARSSNANVAVDMQASRWMNTAAVTSLSVIPSNANSFAAGSTFAIYGVAS